MNGLPGTKCSFWALQQYNEDDIPSQEVYPLRIKVGSWEILLNPVEVSSGENQGTKWSMFQFE